MRSISRLIDIIGLKSLQLLELWCYRGVTVSVKVLLAIIDTIGTLLTFYCPTEISVNVLFTNNCLIKNTYNYTYDIYIICI